MTIQQNISLQPYNTFGVQSSAKYFTTFNTIDELAEVIDFTKKENENFLIIGGGSNILFTQNFNGIVAKNNLQGITLVNEDENFFYIKANAGVIWHSFVLHCIANNYAGVENLSLIPGCVGASPIQNIGAYGVEIKDVFYELEAFNINEKKLVHFSLNDCAFGYRESVFKTIYKNQFVITSVTFKLHKQPQFNTKYGAIEQELQKMNCTTLSIQNISQAVINIRSSKLPNPQQIGNAGSFFKNPIIDAALYSKLIAQYATMPVYAASGGNYKLAAGWLIEQCGFKGYRKNDAGCHSLQALVLVNYGIATGKEIFDISTEIIDAVHQKFGVVLEREVNVM